MDSRVKAVLNLNLFQKHSQFLLKIIIRLNLFKILVLETDNLLASHHHVTYGLTLITY
jgi:hypothetical protein